MRNSAMPRPTPKKLECDVCCSAIVEGKEVALQCEGSCQMWLHRYCAGVSVSHFKLLANSSTPFVCTYCSQQVHQATVCQFQSEVAALKAEVVELRSALDSLPSNAGNSDTIAALTSEVQQLKVAAADAPTLSLQDNPTVSVPWNEVVRRGKRNPKTGQPPAMLKESKVATKRNAQTHVTGDRTVVEAKDAPGMPQSPKRPWVQISGARKVWGTLKNTSTAKVPLDSLTIKRKYKTVHKNSRQVVVRWWFVIRGEERILQELQEFSGQPNNLETGARVGIPKYRPSYRPTNTFLGSLYLYLHNRWNTIAA